MPGPVLTDLVDLGGETRGYPQNPQKPGFWPFWGSPGGPRGAPGRGGENPRKMHIFRGSPKSRFSGFWGVRDWGVVPCAIRRCFGGFLGVLGGVNFGRILSIFVPDGRVIKYPPKCTPPGAGGPAGPPGGAPQGAPPGAGIGSAESGAPRAQMARIGGFGGRSRLPPSQWWMGCHHPGCKLSIQSGRVTS